MEARKAGPEPGVCVVFSILPLQPLITSIAFISALSALLRSLSRSLCPLLVILLPPPHRHAVTRRLVARVNSYVTTAAVLSGLGWWWLVGVGVCVFGAGVFVYRCFLCFAQRPLS